MEKFKNKYRIKSHRKPNWDYSADGLYFLTVVTQNRFCNLGEIVDKKMKMSEFGKIVETEWYRSFEIRSELLLHEFVIMPNHLHTIVEIDHSESVDTHGRVYLPINPINPINSEILIIKRNHPVRLPKSISSFMAGFKSAVNTKINDHIDEYQLNIPKYNRNNHFFQPNYHDHIIRNANEYERIKYYIIQNPDNWNKDKLNASII